MAKVDPVGITLRPAQFKSLLTAAIPGAMRVLVKGAPGIGKTEIIEDVVKRASADLITMYPSVSEPVDFKGAPWVVVGADGKPNAEFIPFGDLRQIDEATRSGRLTVVFMDDMGQGTQATQAAVMQVLDRYRKFRNIIFWAATNRRGDRAGVSGLLEPVKSRYDTIVEMQPNAADWSEWALDSGDIPPEEIAYIRNVKPEALFAFDPTTDITNSPNPRTWAAVGRKIHPLQLAVDVRFAALVGCVGEAAAVDYNAFLQVVADAPSVDDVLNDPDHARIPENASAMYALSSGLAHRADEKNFDQIAIFILRMHDAQLGDICSYLVQDAARKCRAITKGAGWKKLAKSPVADLIHSAIELNKGRMAS